VRTETVGEKKKSCQEKQALNKNNTKQKQKKKSSSPPTGRADAELFDEPRAVLSEQRLFALAVERTRAHTEVHAAVGGRVRERRCVVTGIERGAQRHERLFQLRVGTGKNVTVPRLGERINI
jgi:hypothetical protein